jgi:hypothetical protein
MAKGATAKVNVENKIREAFGADFVGNIDKKIYVWADDGGEKVQICISMTCPKVPVGVGSENNGIDFDNMPAGGSATEFKPAEITNEETENIRKLLSELGL